MSDKTENIQITYSTDNTVEWDNVPTIDIADVADYVAVFRRKWKDIEWVDFAPMKEETDPNKLKSW